MAMIYRSKPARIITFITLALFLILASTCALFSDDGFPSWLAYVENRVDLDTITEYHVASPDKNISSLEYVPYTALDGSDASKIFAYVYSQRSEFLLAFDARLNANAVRSWIRGSPPLMDKLGPVIKRSVRGFVSGKLEFDLSDLDADPLYPVLGPLPSEYCIFSTETPERNYMLAKNTSLPPKEHGLTLQSFDAAFSSVVGPIYRNLDNDKHYIRILDAEYTGGKYRVLVEIKAGKLASVFSFQNENEFLGSSTFLEDPNAEITGPFSLSDGKAWLTKDGVITFDRDNGNYLVRFKYGEEKTKIDQLLLGDDIDALEVLSFDPSGRWWFMLDRSNGTLYKMRSWWNEP